MRIRDLVAEGRRGLPGAEARREAALLLAHALGVSDAWLVAHGGGEVDAPHAGAFRALLQRRARGEPVAYLTGERGFHALDLQVSPAVLIPRPETELLVDLALERIPADAAFEVADLGTGSGAIALSIARARPRAQVLATDASAAALEVARGNASRLGIGNVAFAEGDWCAALGEGRFQVIVSNPPYVADRDPHLDRGDLRFEPRAALASGRDGLDAIRTLASDAREYLHANGWLLLEHGFDQGAAVRELLARHGYTEVFTARDLGGHERATGGFSPLSRRERGRG